MHVPKHNLRQRQNSTEPPQNCLDGGATSDLFGGLSPGLEQRFDGGGVVALFAVPTVFGAMDGPVQRSAAEIGGGIFEWRTMLQEEPDQLDITQPCGPMQRSGV